MSAIALVRDQLPALFAEGVRALEAKASESPGANALLGDLRAAGGVGRVVFSGSGATAGEVWLRAEAGVLSVCPPPAEGERVEAYVSLDAEVADVLLAVAEKERDLRAAESVAWLPRVISRRLQDTLRSETQSFVLSIKETPDFERVEVRVALGLRDFPDKPRFTVEVKHADLERVERGELTAQQFFMGGKLKFGGDYARALQIAMQLAQPRKK